MAGSRNIAFRCAARELVRCGQSTNSLQLLQRPLWALRFRSKKHQAARLWRILGFRGDQMVGVTTSGEEAQITDTAENDTHSPINWKLIETYESGKSRRYNLFFAVNGGTFAIVSFLMSNAANSTIIMGIFTSFMCLAFIWFSVRMAQDIKEFGTAMRNLNMRSEADRVFGEKGRSLLHQITLILNSTWVGLLLLGLLQLVGVTNL